MRSPENIKYIYTNKVQSYPTDAAKLWAEKQLQGLRKCSKNEFWKSTSHQTHYKAFSLLLL